MKINRSGVTRIVIELDKVVIKIPNFRSSWRLFLEGLLCNLKEKLAWDIAEYTGWQHVLCPVIWMSYGGWILIMKKVKVLTKEEYNNADISQHKIYFSGDDKAENYGWLNNKIVKIDYN